MITQLIEVKDECGLVDDTHFLIDGKESALLVGTESQLTSIGIYLRGASRAHEEPKCDLEPRLEWLELTNVYNDYRIGYETRSLKDADVQSELVRDVLAQGYSMNEIMNGIERIGMSRVKNPRLLTEQQPEWQEQELFVLE